MLGININEMQVKLVTNNLNCRKGSWPFSYLGLPLEGNPRHKVFFFFFRRTLLLRLIKDWMDGKEGVFLEVGE